MDTKYSQPKQKFIKGLPVFGPENRPGAMQVRKNPQSQPKKREKKSKYPDRLSVPLTQKFRTPRQSTPRVTIVSGSDLVGQVNNSTGVTTTTTQAGTILANIELNPTLIVPNGRMDVSSRMFGRYKFRSLRFRYESVVGTGTTGAILGFIDRDAAFDPTAYTPTHLMQRGAATVGGHSFSVWEGNSRAISWVLPRITGKQDWPVDTTTGSRNDHSVGRLVLISMSALTAQTYGNLFVEYTLEFSNPHLYISEGFGSEYGLHQSAGLQQHGSGSALNEESLFDIAAAGVTTNYNFHSAGYGPDKGMAGYGNAMKIVATTAKYPAQYIALYTFYANLTAAASGADKLSMQVQNATVLDFHVVPNNSAFPSTYSGYAIIEVQDPTKDTYVRTVHADAPYYLNYTCALTGSGSVYLPPRPQTIPEEKKETKVSRSSSSSSIPLQKTMLLKTSLSSQSNEDFETVSPSERLTTPTRK